MPVNGASTSPPATDDVPVWEVVATAFRAWRGGDEHAVEVMVRAATPTLWHVVRAYRVDEEQARDVVQTTWTALVQRGGTIEDPQAVMAWLLTSARREAWRVAGRAARTDPVADEVLEARTPPRPSVEHEVGRTLRDRQLWTAVAALTERCRRLLRVVAFEDRPDYRTLAQELGMAVGSIGPTRGRCLDRLRATLAEAGADEEELR